METKQAHRKVVRSSILSTIEAIGTTAIGGLLAAWVHVNKIARAGSSDMTFQTNAFQGDDADLLARIRRFENHLVERKTASDKKDWLKTIVAFTSSTPDGLTAVLFIGVTNEGVVEDKQNDLDAIQKR